MLRREQSRLPGKRKETMLNRNMRNTAILLVVFLAVYMFGNYFAEKNLMSGSGSSSYSYERLESDIAKNKVKSIEVVQNAQVPTGSAIVKLNDGEKKVAHVTDVNKVIDLAQTTVRTVTGIEVEAHPLSEGEYPSKKVIIRVTGEGFLYNMVRIISGTLIKVGLGVYPPEHVKQILEACDRSQAGETVPAKGLFLKKIEYL